MKLIPTEIRFLEEALEFCVSAHGDQKRKYTGAPYWTHPVEVAFYVKKYVGDVDSIIAAYLHDVVEDTPITAEDIGKRFGSKVARLVLEVTKISKPSDGNREKRKAIDRAHYARASHFGASIKIADIISNASDIMTHDPAFGCMYLQESRRLLRVLRHGNEDLHSIAMATIDCALDNNR